MRKLISEQSLSKPNILPKTNSVTSANTPPDEILEFIYTHAYIFPHPLPMQSSQYSGVPPSIRDVKHHHYHPPP